MDGYRQASPEGRSAAEALAELWELFRAIRAERALAADRSEVGRKLPPAGGPESDAEFWGAETEVAGRDEGELVLAAARLAWLDWAGVALYGLGTSVGRSLASLVGDPEHLAGQVAGLRAAPAQGRRAGEGPGGPLAPAWSLALLLGAAAHAAELDDTLPDSMVHAGAPVVAAAWTAALACAAGTRKFLEAVAFGYEVAGRIGQAVNSPPGLSLHTRGFHPTGVVGVLGAAAAAAALNELEREGRAAALTLAASMGGGILEFLSGGGDSKALHAGKAAADGVLAASLAALGLRGPRHALEGRDGFFHAFGEQGRLGGEGGVAKLERPLAARSAHVVRTLRKYHACCHHCQPAVDALAGLVDQAGLRASELARDVTSIEVMLPFMAYYQVAVPIEGKRRPSTRLEAQLSLPYCVAAWLVLGHLGPSAFEAPYREDPRILKLADTVQARPSAEMDAHFARGHMPAVVRVYRRNGSVLEGDCGLQPLKADLAGLRAHLRREGERVRQKWSALLDPRLGPGRVEVLWEMMAHRPVTAFEAALTGLHADWVADSKEGNESWETCTSSFTERGDRLCEAP